MASNNQGNKDGNKQSGTSNRGFASMDPERQREIASEGGKAAHEKGTAHEFTSEEARRAGSMSHGNRQSEQASASSKQKGEQGGKQADKAGSKQSEQRGGRAGAQEDGSEDRSRSDKSR
jgi:general stress protein YciG